MFIYQAKKCRVVIPQRNHAHLASQIAEYWGNNSFELPKIPLETIVKGIAFHQNGYEPFDTISVKELTGDALAQILKRDFYYEMGDIEAELISMFHQHRLVQVILSNRASEEFLDLEMEFDHEIHKKLQSSKYDKTAFIWSNRITHLCDKLSFNFCIGNKVEETVPLFRKVSDELSIDSHHSLFDTDKMKLKPWPFSSESIKLNVVGYKSEKYPEQLDPVLLRLELSEKFD